MEHMEELVGVLLTVARVKHYDFILVGSVEVLVKSEKFVDPQIRIHRADAVKKYIWTAHFILLGLMFHNPLMDESEEILAMGVTAQSALHIIRLFRFVLLLLQQVLKKRFLRNGVLSRKSQNSLNRSITSTSK